MIGDDFGRECLPSVSVHLAGGPERVLTLDEPDPEPLPPFLGFHAGGGDG